MATAAIATGVFRGMNYASSRLSRFFRSASRRPRLVPRVLTAGAVLLPKEMEV